MVALAVADADLPPTFGETVVTGYGSVVISKLGHLSACLSWESKWVSNFDLFWILPTPASINHVLGNGARYIRTYSCFEDSLSPSPGDRSDPRRHEPGATSHDRERGPPGGVSAAVRERLQTPAWPHLFAERRKGSCFVCCKSFVSHFTQLPFSFRSQMEDGTEHNPLRLEDECAHRLLGC